MMELEDSHPNAPRIFALVVTVDKYKDPNFGDLTGCKNDGTKFIQYLVDVLGVPRSRIVFLADEQATERAILDGFNRFLLHNADIHRDDPIVFFFAGHGRKLCAPDGWVTESGKIEELCPHDIQTIGDDGEELWGIPDRTIDAILRELAYEKGDNIITVFDCCFSGGLSRGEGDGLRVRALPEYPLSPPADLHRQIVSSSRAAQTVIQPGFRYKAMESHILLAACRPDEFALENPFSKDGPGGLFTSALIESLTHRSIHDTSYATLFHSLDLDGKQHPQCEGTNKNRLLFSVNMLRDGRPSFKVYRRGKNLFVSAGSVHGITEDTVFIILSTSDTFVRKASEVRSFGTRLEGPSLSIADDARAFVSSSPALRVHSSLDLSNLVHVTVVPAETYADIALRRSDSKWELERFDPFLSTYSDRVIRFAAADRQIPDVLGAIANFHACLYRTGDPGASAFSGKIKTRLNRLGRVGNEYGPVGEDLLTGRVSHGGVDARTAEITDTEGDYCLTLENHSDVNLFLYLFYFDPSDYSIQAWYHPQGATTSALLFKRKEDGPSVFPFGYGGFGTDPIQFYLPEGQDVDSVFVKAFLTTTYVDLAHVAQAGIEECESRSRFFGRGLNTWTSETFVLTCKRSRGDSECLVD